MADHSQLQQHFLQQLKPHFPDLTDKEILFQIFQNYRESQGKGRGLRLTHKGHTLASKYYETYTFTDIDKYQKGAILILDSHQQWPYYLSGNRVVFYEEIDASMFRIAGHNLDDYTRNLKDG